MVSDEWTAMRIKRTVKNKIEIKKAEEGWLTLSDTIASLLGLEAKKRK